MRWLTAACVVVGLMATLRGQSTDWPLNAVMSRAATYIERYADTLSGLVVEESYVQDVIAVNRFGYRVSAPRGPIHRTLRSDLLLVRPANADAWVQFRDVFEVDGRPVRDRNDRLAKLFLEPAGKNSQAEKQTEKIVRESARYNIGDIERTINIPVLALTILDRRAQQGFEFTLGDVPDAPALPKLPAFTPPADAVVVGFKETQVRSLIVNPQGKNLRSRGRFWISLPTGRVMMSELVVEDFTLNAIVHVAYAEREGYDVPVPAQMHEAYLNRLNNSRVEGTATYSNFREFGVKTDEAIASPPPTDP